MTAPDLLVCPFCGGKAVAFSYITEGAVRCGGCHAAITRGHKHTSETGYEEAIAAWNTRATPAPDAAIREAALRSLAALVAGMDAATFLDFARDMDAALQTHKATQAAARILALTEKPHDRA